MVSGMVLLEEKSSWSGETRTRVVNGEAEEVSDDSNAAESTLNTDPSATTAVTM